MMSGRGAATRQNLLAAAKELFISSGWEGTAAVAIRKTANVSQGSWAHAFPKGKEEIGVAIYLELFDAIWGGVLQALGRDGSAGDRLKRIRPVSAVYSA